TAAGCHPHYPLARAIPGNILADHFRAANLGAGLELLAQGLADIGHIIEIVDTKVMYPLHDLPGTEALFSDFLEKSFQPGPCQAQQIYPGGVSHCDTRSEEHTSEL